MADNRIFAGPPGTGKTYCAKQAVLSLIWDGMTDKEKKKKESRYYRPENFCGQAFQYAEKHYFPGIRLVSLHEGMSPADFTGGPGMTTEDGRVVFAEKEGILTGLLDEMKTTQKPGFLILDDIHRVDTAAVLGELLYAFAHRGESVTLASGKSITVPENLYVFMTANTLRPAFGISAAVRNGFSVIQMENTEKKLEELLVSEFYRSAYYNIETETLEKVIDLQSAWKELISAMRCGGILLTASGDTEQFLLELPDVSRCFGEKEAERFLQVTFPLKWTRRAGIPRRFIKKYNALAEKMCDALNELWEMYSRFCSKKTVSVLDDFREEVKKEYRYYNGFLDGIAPEFSQDREKYRIGCTCFLPGENFSMWNARELLQNKIRAQVLPFLRQYREEGILVEAELPEAERTYVSTTRELGEVQEEKIEPVIHQDYRKIFLNLYQGRKRTAGVQNPLNKSQKYNPTYGVLFELVCDMICHPLINNWSIMEILCRGREIYFKRDETGQYEGCLLDQNRLSDRIVTGSTDTTPGNEGLTSYKRDLHAFYYKGQKYVLLSKIGLDNKDFVKTVDDCRLTGPVRARYRNLYPIVKVLVYEYLQEFRNQLQIFKRESPDADERKAADDDIRMVSEDLERIDQMAWHGGNPDERRWNLLGEIRALPTWSRMLSGDLKGVYRRMDDRYQSVMESTGIHQMILQGPPGTSKTYGAREFLAIQAGLISQRGEHWDEEELKKRQLVSDGDEYSLPGGLTGNDNVYWDIIQFHPSYTYEDFVRGIAVTAAPEGTSEVTGEVYENGTAKYTLKMQQPSPVIYKTVNRTLGKMARIAGQHYNAVNPENSPRFYLIIDEINRANLATVFGELIYALEYRDSGVVTPYAAEGEARLKIPGNLYIIGTMNTADKSISSIDYAIRRRFLFFPVLPDIRIVYGSLNGDDWKTSDELKLFHLTERVFDLYLNADDYSRADVQTGHTYFLRKENTPAAAAQMRDRFLYQVVPVLREYYNDGVLLNDTYGRDPEVFEEEAFRILEELMNSADPDEMEQLYGKLLEELSAAEFLDSIREKLEEKNILAAASSDDE